MITKEDTIRWDSHGRGWRYYFDENNNCVKQVLEKRIVSRVEDVVDGVCLDYKDGVLIKNKAYEDLEK